MNRCVYVVDDDAAIRASIRLLLESVGHRVHDFDSAETFLESYRSNCPGCLITDLKMPGLSGLELQFALEERDTELPVIMLTGHGDVPAAVQSMKHGALDFVQKPFDPNRLLELVSRALDIASARFSARREQDERDARLRKLTPREREVIDRIGRGRSNKVVAIEFGISERTVEQHRSRAMKKLGVRNVADLALLLSQIGTPT